MASHGRVRPVVIDITGGPLSPDERAIHAEYQSDDADADYYDGDEDCGCSVVHPRWCFWNGPCCDHCSHEQHQCDDQTRVLPPDVSDSTAAPLITNETREDT